MTDPSLIHKLYDLEKKVNDLESEIKDSRIDADVAKIVARETNEIVTELLEVVQSDRKITFRIFLIQSLIFLAYYLYIISSI
jgi:hypothetical protein